jgi:iron complex transport system substrate-binding protein
MTTRRFHSIVAGLALALFQCWAGSAAAEAPRRVVSMNLCTDQLAMLLAAPDQLYSVSDISLDTRMSSMTEEARNYVINQGLAEEIYLMQPDLVLAGNYTARASVAMLRRLGVNVVVFEQAQTLPEVRQGILRMGEVLHRKDAAQAMVDEFDAKLATLQSDITKKPDAMLYYANGYTSSNHTLAGQILLAAGFDNAAVKAGLGRGMKLPLEVLAMMQPDIVITSQPYPGASRSEAIMKHPVVRTLRETLPSASVTDHDWVCGTPYVLRAIESLAETRRALTKETQ